MENVKSIAPKALTESSEAPTALDRDTAEKMIQAAIDDAIRQTNTKIDEQMQKSQDSFITIFGIFSSVLSFLTIEFQFLRTLSHIGQVAGFSLLLFSLLLSFNLALDYMVAQRFHRESHTYRFLMILILVTFSAGMFVMWFTYGGIHYE